LPEGRRIADERRATLGMIGQIAHALDPLNIIDPEKPFRNRLKYRL